MFATGRRGCLLSHQVVCAIPDYGAVEARFCFVQERDKNLGGNSLFRSEERIATEKRYLKRKWKAHIRLETYKSQDRVAMDAPRRQPVKL